MKFLFFGTIIMICALWSCDTDYTYKAHSRESILVDTFRCGDTARIIYGMVINPKTKYFLFEDDNLKKCSVSVMHGLWPLKNGGKETVIAPEQHLVHIGDIPAGGEKYDFKVGCTSSELDYSQCTFTFAPYLCDNVKGEKPSDKYVSLQSARDASINSYPSTDSLCITPDSNRAELLVIENDSNTDHEISMTIESTCSCPAFHVDPPGIFVKAGESKSEKVLIEKKSTVRFIAYCTGEDVVDPKCSGRIRDIQLKTKQ